MRYVKFCPFQKISTSVRSSRLLKLKKTEECSEPPKQPLGKTWSICTAYVCSTLCMIPFRIKIFGNVP